jgi:peroxiredoxin
MKTKMTTALGLLVVIAAFFISADDNIQGYDVGDMAKDFKLPNIDGKTVSLSDYSDAEGFIVIFTCNTCPYAKMYEQRIIDLDKKYASQGFPVIAINPNDIAQKPGDSMEEMKKRAADKGYTFPYLRDDEQELTKMYGATKTPHVYLLDKEGNDKYRVAYIGAIDDSPQSEADVTRKYVEDAIAALKADKTPPTTSERAIGCTIKWKSK